MIQKMTGRFSIGFGLCLAACTLALAGFFVFADRVVAQLTPPAPFDINGSLAPSGASLSGQAAVSFSVSTGIYTFRYPESGNALAQYELNTTDPDIQKGLLKIKEAVTNSFPMAQAGPSYRKLDGTVLTPRQFVDQLDVPGSSAGATFEHQQFGSAVSFLITHTLGGIETKLRYDFELKGKTLVIRASAVNPRTGSRGNYAGIVFGQSAQTPNLREAIIPYVDSYSPVLIAGAPGDDFFFSTYWDPARTNSNDGTIKEGSRTVNGEYVWTSYSSRYIGGENDVYPPFDETAYLTVSREVSDLFPEIHRSASPYRADLTNRVALDIWYSLDRTSYERDEWFIRRAKALGMDTLAVAIQHWQKYGFDCGNPTHYPANPALGDEASLRSAISAAKGFGWLVALRENYFWLSERSDYWTHPLGGPQAVAKHPDGTLKRFDDWGCVSRSYIPAADRMSRFAQLEAQLIKANYGTNASYLDVTPSIHFSATTPQFPNWIDYSATNANARSWKDVLRALLDLDANQHAVYQGPLWGEGVLPGFPQWNHSFTSLEAGAVDGTEGELTLGTQGKVIPDFALKEVKPLMANWGMGKHGQWDTEWGQNPRLETFDFDKYRATTIAYGHTGYMIGLIGEPDSIPVYLKYWAKEYYTFRDLQSQYLAAPVQQILYENPSGALVDLNQALKGNFDFKNAKLKITYQNGLVMYINRHQSQMWTVNEGGRAYYLPPNGWVAVNPSLAYTNYSALVDANGNPNPSGHRVDYVQSLNYTMADGRGTATNFGGAIGATARLKVVKSGGWTLAESANGGIATPDTPTPAITLLNPAQVVNTANQEVTVTGTGFERYSVVRANGALPLPMTYVDSQTLRFTIFAGTPPATYQISVMNGSSGLVSDERPVEVLAQSSQPAAPTGLAASAASQTQINLNWTDNATNETGYRVERAGSASGPFTAITGPNHLAANTTVFNDTNLSANTTYYYRVIAFNVAGDSGPSNTASATTNSAQPNAPAGLTASAASPTSIRLAWADASTNETGFRVERAPSAGGPFAAITTAPSHLAANTTSYTDTNVSPVTTYYYRVVAFNAAGDSAPSNTANAITPQMPDTQAPAVSLTAPAANAVVAATITVRANATDNVGVLGVQFLLDGGNLGLEDTVAPYEIQWDTLAATNGSHTLSARARDAAGNIGNAQGVAVIVRNLPNAPTTLAASAISTSQINLSWVDNATNETGYAVERGTDGVNFLTIAANLSPNTASFADLGLAAATRYYYRVRAFNTGGDSGYSNVANATTQAAPPPPFNFSLVITENRSVAQGSSVTNAVTISLTSGTGQNVAFSASGIPNGATPSFAPPLCAPPCQSTFTIATSGTTPVGNHQIIVTGTAGSIIQTASFTLTVTAPPPTRPAAPTGLSATAASPTQISLSWTNIATNATGIRVQGSAVSATGPFATLPNGGSLAPNTVGFSNANLTPNTRYWYRVIAWNAAGDSDASNVATVLTPQTPDTQTPTVTLTSPAAQATVSATVAVRASASDNVGVAGVQFLLNGQSIGAEDTVAPYEVQWDTSEAANGTHRLSARARDGAGNTRVAVDVPVTVNNIALLPRAPTNLAAQTFSSARVNLTWTDNAVNETRYEIERSVNAGSFQRIAGNLSANTVTYSDTSVSENTLYTYRVRAANDAGASNYSNEANARTPGGDNPPPSPTPTPSSQAGLSAPSNFRITPRSTTRADFSWTDTASGEQGFKLEHSHDGATFREVATLPANFGGYAYEGLTPGSLNYYRIRAFSGSRFSPYSSVVTVRMLATTPPAGAFTEELRFGSRHAQVRLLQELLIREGVYPEAIVSGYFGILTQKSVIRFQGKYGITQSVAGVVDAATRAKLNERYGTVPSPTPVPMPGGGLTKNFGPGDRDSQIKLLQQWLNRDAETRVAASGVGSSGSETDYYGGLTTAAVERFQRKQGIVSSGTPATTGYGRVGPRTRAELNRIYGAP